MSSRTNTPIDHTAIPASLRTEALKRAADVFADRGCSKDEILDTADTFAAWLATGERTGR